MTTATPRIYVASLSDYVAGRLLGRWIDADQEPDEIRAEIQAMLATSEQAPAEEWAIHDFDNFGRYRVSEYASIDLVSLVGRAIAEADSPAFNAWLERAYEHIDFDDYLDDVTGLVEVFQQQDRGHWDTFKDFVEEEWGEIFLGLHSLREAVANAEKAESYPGHRVQYAQTLEELESYIDWDKVATAVDHSGAFFEVEGDNGVYIFEIER